MFNPVESRYSQLKLELYGVLRALKAKRHWLHSIHFKLQVDASSIIQMVNAPDLPNAAMTRWITYIQLFSFEVEHIKAKKHWVPNGLSWRPWSEEDSDQSDSKVDVEDGIKLVELFSGDFEQVLSLIGNKDKFTRVVFASHHLACMLLGVCLSSLLSRLKTFYCCSLKKVLMLCQLMHSHSQEFMSSHDRGPV